MIPVYQKTSDDCFRCCLASLLELPYVNIPNFMSKRSDNRSTVDENELAEMDDWFNARRMRLLRFPIPGFNVDLALKRASAIQPPDIGYIIGGLTMKGVAHANVCRNGVITHDPAQPVQPLYAPFDGGYFMAYFIGMKV